MKKLVVLLSIVLFLTGCANMLSDSASVSIAATLHTLDTTRAALDSDDYVVSMDVWISEQGVDYKFALESETATESTTAFYENEEESKLDLESDTIRHITGTDSVSFDISVNIPKTFTVRAVFNSGRVFMGSVDRAITEFVDTIEVDIYETSTSEAIESFSDLETWIDTYF